MTSKSKVARRFAQLVSGAALVALATAAQAQTVAPPSVPLNDAQCQFSGTFLPLLSGCIVNGTRTHSTPIITTTAIDATTTRVVHSERVNFSGRLAAEGVPIVTPSAPVGSFFNTPALFASLAGAADVDVTTTYDASSTYFVPTASLPFALPQLSQPLGVFFNTNVTSLQVNRIGVDIQNATITDAASGQDYLYSLAATDPNAIVVNSTALAGKYQSTNGGPIVFGKLSGSATLVNSAGSAVFSASGQLDANGNPISGWLSPFALQYNVTATELTRLDETGLVTPQIAVTDGIQMNGSRVSGLAAGANPDDAVNKAQLDAEAAARQNADLALQNGINTEVAARTAADLAINQRIAIEESNRAALGAALTSETNARAAADLALSNRIDVIGSRLDKLQSQVDLLDKHIASSTAVAVAMSGNTFLPDMKFNLTANIGTYGGAQAGSIQIGALVSPHVAINAGVATGFNKGGKTAGRVGMTFGW